MLVHARSIIKTCRRTPVVAFNTINAETTLAIARAATAVKAPTLFEVSEKTVTYLGINTVVALISSIVKSKDISAPLAIHLDHGKSFAITALAVQAGFTSVMIDGSALSFKANVALTQQVVKYAHRRRVLVQGEVGALKPTTGLRSVARVDLMTDPVQAREFVKLTSVDTLGVAVGTLHGPAKIFNKTAKIDFVRLSLIHKAVSIPLVLHGASGVPVNDLIHAHRLGVGIINIDTELRLAYLSSLRAELKRQISEYDPRVVFEPVIDAMQHAAEYKLRSLRSL